MTYFYQFINDKINDGEFGVQLTVVSVLSCHAVLSDDSCNGVCY